LARFDDASRKKLTHDIGNLALTKDNASYGNKPFPLKKGTAGLGKPCYAESPFFMERELATLPDWDPLQLTARRGGLVHWALARWHVQPVQNVSAPKLPGDDDAPEDEIVAVVDEDE
jgi:hypothetical protein